MIVTLVTKEQEKHYRIPFHYAHGELERVWESDICYATVPPTITEGVKAITLLVEGRFYLHMEALNGSRVDGAYRACRRPCWTSTGVGTVQPEKATLASS